MYLLLFTILTAVSVSVVNQSATDDAYQATRLEMLAIRNAMVGDPEIKTRGVRTDFGYNGDIGALPSAIGSLLTKPGGDSAWTTDNTRRFMSGWNGPYLKSANSGADFTRDQWGNAYVYTPGASPATLVSYGADGAAGGVGLNQDLTIEMPTTSRFATVHGFLVDSGSGTAANVVSTITLHYPNGAGARTSTSVSTIVGDNGHFSFANVPLGVRSAEIVVGATTYGPVIFTVDRTNYTIPTSLTEVTTAACTTQTIAFQAATSSGSETTTSVNIVVEASATCTSDMTVDYALANGTATGGSDYTAASGTITITAGNTTANLTIAITNDGTNEANETLTATLSNPLPSGVTLGATTVHTYTIVDNDCASGNSALTANGTFTVPNGCTSLVIKAWGGGGGGGANNAVESGHGGAGGYAYTNALAVTPGDTFDVVIGLGGEPGKCGNPPDGGGGAHAGGNGGQAAAGAPGSGAGVGGAGGAGVNAGGAGKYGGGGGGGMAAAAQRGGGGGGSTQVTQNSGPTVILIAGGGGGGGGGSNAGVDLGGDGGAGCGLPGGASSPGLSKGGAGGAGACFGANTGTGVTKVPANSAQAGAGVAVGGDDGGACAGAGLGGNGKVRFEYN